jgi:hypothetical protein
MKLALLLTVCGVLLLGAPVGAQQPPAGAPAEQAPPEETGPPKQEAVSGGTLPDDLLGRWLVIGWVGIRDEEHAKTTAALWDVTREDAQIVFTENYREMPSRIAQALADANAEDRAWRPSPQDLSEIANGWDTLPMRDPKVATQRNEIYGKDGFDRDFQNEEQTKNAIWAARQTSHFRRSAQPSVRGINVFGATEARDGGYAGNYTTATIAAAPFPIPITLKGKFQMYRVAGASEPKARKGFWSSLFSGCGK